MRTRGFSVFEMLLVALLACVLLALVAGLYGRLARDVHYLGLDIAAHSFSAAVSGVRAQWYIDPDLARREGVAVYARLNWPGEALAQVPQARVYLNEAGWPVASHPGQIPAPGQLRQDHCEQLWRALVGASTDPALAVPYAASLEPGGRCRYRSQTVPNGYLDYVPDTGEVRLHRPAS